MAKVPHLPGLLPVLIIIGVVISPVLGLSQPSLFFTPDVVESNTGDDAIVHLMIDNIPRGISGFGMIISLDNPDIAEIIGIDLPRWLGLQDIQRHSESSFWIQGVNSGNLRQPETQQIGMAAIKVHAKAPGYAKITATPVFIDTNQKGRYESSPVAMTVVITGAGPVPPNSPIPMNT